MFKPREQWHAFWNAGDEPCRILEIISRGAFEHMFREMGELIRTRGLDDSADFTGRYGIEFDLEATARLVEEHGLVGFG